MGPSVRRDAVPVHLEFERASRDLELLGSPGLILYARSWFVAFRVFVRWFDQGFLARTFGADYATYYSATPRWIALSRSRQGTNR